MQIHLPQGWWVVLCSKMLAGSDEKKKKKPSESCELHYTAPFLTLWHEPLTFQRQFKPASTPWHKLVHATLIVCWQTGKHTNTFSECSWNHQLSGHKWVMHNRGGYTQELVKWPQQCAAVIVNTLCCNMLVDSQTVTFKVLYNAQDSSCVWTLQCHSNGLESVLLQELAKGWWCSANTQWYVPGSVNHMLDTVFMSVEKSFFLNTEILILCGNLKVWMMEERCILGNFHLLKGKVNFTHEIKRRQSSLRCCFVMHKHCVH